MYFDTFSIVIQYCYKMYNTKCNVTADYCCNVTFCIVYVLQLIELNRGAKFEAKWKDRSFDSLVFPYTPVFLRGWWPSFRCLE